jgi:hypothetical protein
MKKSYFEKRWKFLSSYINKKHMTAESSPIADKNLHRQEQNIDNYV